jgi:SAM-dependent methyltransferase
MEVYSSFRKIMDFVILMSIIINMKSSLSKEPYKSYNGFGVDVAIKRTDDLDKRMLEHLRIKDKPKVLDLGSGAGGQSVRMVEVGALVLAVDVYDFSAEFAEYRVEHGWSEEVLKFIPADIGDLSNLLQGEKFSDASMQRTLHYLPYGKALEALKFLRTMVQDKLFISVTGMDSAVGDNYVGKDLPINERFVKLSPVEADIFQIQAPVCLYRQEEFIILLERAGWKVEDIWQSAFGNLKAVCV